ncbi:MAG: hypothetical protein AAFX95_11205 [Cyanobacteria bacterium J06639_16]
MNYQRFLSFLLTMSAFGYLAVRPVEASRSQSNDTEPNSVSSSLTAAQARPGFELHRQRNFSVEYPTGWLVDNSGNTGSDATLWNRQPPTLGGGEWPSDLVRTNIDIVNSSYSSVVRGLEQSDNSEILRRGEVTIGGMRALRVWSIGINSLVIQTIVEYSDSQTAIISSFYADDIWIEDIQDVHWSFRKLN